MVDGRLAVQLTKALAEFGGVFDIGSRIVFMDLEDDGVTGQARSLEGYADPWQEGGICHGAMGNVDEQAGFTARGTIYAEHIDGLQDHPTVEFFQQASVLCRPQELGW